MKKTRINHDDPNALGYINPAPVIGESVNPSDKVPADQIIQEERRREAEHVPSRSPRQAVAVTSTYDARPVNGYDFILTERYQSVCLLPATVLTYTVPEGYIAVLRQLRGQVINDGTGVGDLGNVPYWPAFMTQPPEWNIKINGRIPEGLTHLDAAAIATSPFVGAAFDWEDFFTIAETGSIITVEFAGGSGGLGGGFCNGASYIGKVWLRGNLLLARGVPAKFEIGNLKGVMT